jgi:acyl carrier protein
VATDTFERVRRIIARYLDVPVESVTEDSALEALGLDSLGALELVYEIEEEFKISVPDDRLAEFTTVRVVVDGVEALLRAAATG